MPSSIHPKEDERETAVINFRCNPRWKRKVAMELARRGDTLQSVGVEAISKYLNIPTPKSGDGAAA